jgi:PAS domain S-box-containing protein
MQISGRFRASIVWVTVLAALAVNSAVSIFNVNQLIDNEAQVDRSRQLLAELNLLMSDVKDAETGQRGYLITSDEAYLEPYSQVRKQIHARLERLQAQTSDNPQRREALTQVEALIADKLQELDWTITAHRERRVEAARLMVLSGKGKKSMDDIRLGLGTMIERENDVLSRRAVIANDKYRTTLATTAVGGLLTLGMTAVAFILFRRDIARRLKQERALRESQARFRTLAQSMPQLVWVARADGFAEYFNQRWFDYTGLAFQESVGFRWCAPLYPDDKGTAESSWKRAVDAGEPWEGEFRIRGAGGSYRWFLGRALPQKNEDGRIANWFGAWTDIHERKEAEHERSRQAELLEQLVQERTLALSQSVAALAQEVEVRQRAEENERAAAEDLRRSNRELEQFAYVASHDLQEPLRKIQAFGDRLSKRCSDQLDEQGREYLERITKSATRMRTLISDLLSLSRVALRTRPFVRVDLAEVVQSVLGDLDNLVASTGGRIEIGPLDQIDADGVQIQQLLQNLIGNALKFHRAEVPPVVTIRSGIEKEAADGPGGTGREVCRLEISDNGIGFEERYGERIFQVFQRLHGRSEYEGTGIGLAICRKIAERHDGRIWASSVPGQGSTFTVVLPVHQFNTADGSADGEDRPPK